MYAAQRAHRVSVSGVQILIKGNDKSKFYNVKHKDKPAAKGPAARDIKDDAKWIST